MSGGQKEAAGETEAQRKGTAAGRATVAGSSTSSGMTKKLAWSCSSVVPEQRGEDMSRQCS